MQISKTILKWFLTSVTIVTLTACGGGSGGDSSSAETPSTIATDKIMAYANDQTQPIPTVKDYTDAGVTGVTAENITDINDIVASLKKEDVDTKEEIQTIVEELGINLPDTIPPVITLNGNSTMTVMQGDIYTDAGATATDNSDGSITVTTAGNVDTSLVGTYTITYTATDSAGNSTTKTRTVEVTAQEVCAQVITHAYNPTTGEEMDFPTPCDVPEGWIVGNAPDITPPVITLNGTNPTTVTQGNAYMDAGASATDDKDGAVGVIMTGSVNTSVTGTYTITYTATDSANNTATATRTVNVEPAPNTAPTANAGSDKTTEVDEAVVITGTGSDSDGTIVQYEWKKGSTIIGITATITYTPTAAGTDTLTLTVTDNDGAQASDSMIVTVTAEYIPYEVPEIDESTKQAYLDAVNAARAEEQDCGTHGMMGPAAPLVWNDALYKASYEHSDDMMRSNTFSHTGSNTEYDWTAVILDLGRGSNLQERVENNGYSSWSAISENIATYKGFTNGLTLVINLWLDSDGHCKNLMNSAYEEIGMAHVDNGSGDYTDYWTQNFGTRQ